jgi:hypothetical protein
MNDLSHMSYDEISQELTRLRNEMDNMDILIEKNRAELGLILLNHARRKARVVEISAEIKRRRATYN